MRIGINISIILFILKSRFTMMIRLIKPVLNRLSLGSIGLYNEEASGNNHANY